MADGTPVVSLRQFLDRHGVVAPYLLQADQLHPQSSFEKPCAFSKSATWQIPISIGAFSMVHGPGHVQAATIGRYCSIAPYAVIGANEHALEWLSTSSMMENPRLFNWHSLPGLGGLEQTRGLAFPDSVKPIKIGNDVWIGHGAFIKGGVTIGDGAVIGSMANVIHDIPPYAIAVGNPARVVRMRFDEDVVKLCLEVQWWRFTPDVMINSDPRNVRACLENVRTLERTGKIQPLASEMLTGAELRKAGYFSKP